MQSQRMTSSLQAGFSGRVGIEQTTFRPNQWHHFQKHRTSRKRQQDFRCLAADTKSGLGNAVKKFARKVQAGLPIVGLLSRLATDVGGIGDDEMAYPEFARRLLNVSDANFNEAAAAWSEKYGQVGQRKYILLFLWMARTGLGYVPSKKIALAASRLRVSQDIEVEVERFEMARKEALEMYAFDDRPKGRTQEQVNIAVDSLCRLSPGLKDGEAIPEDVQKLLVSLITAAFIEDNEAIAQIVQEAVSDQSRAERRNANQ